MNVHIESDEQREARLYAERSLGAPNTAEGRECGACVSRKSAEAIEQLRAGRMGRLPESRFDEMKICVENMTGGANTVLLDDAGMPSIVAGLPKMRICDLYGGDDESIHPAWIVDGSVKEMIYVSKYMNFVDRDRAYSLPMRDPHVFFTFDDGVRFCLNKGRGWHLLTNVEWMALAQQSKRLGTRPRGNTDRGRAHDAPWEKGVPTAMNGYDVQRTAAGSGPVTWNHNHQPSGVADLVGNMFEWVGGLRLMDGEIQIISQNTAAVYSASMLAPDSHYWRGLTTKGELAAHGEKDTYKVDGLVPGDCLEEDHLLGRPIISTRIRNRSYTGPYPDGNQGFLDCQFCDLTVEEGLPVPRILNILGVVPDETCIRQDGIFVARNYGERIAVRGGKAGSLDRAGLNALHFYNPRTYDGSATIGFRSAYVD